MFTIQAVRKSAKVVKHANMVVHYEPRHEKTNNVVFEQVRHKLSCTSTEVWLEAVNFEFMQKRNCTIRVVKTKVLISFAVTAKLTCTFDFAYADCWLSYATVHTATKNGHQSRVNIFLRNWDSFLSFSCCNS